MNENYVMHPIQYYVFTRAFSLKEENKLINMMLIDLYIYIAKCVDTTTVFYDHFHIQNRMYLRQNFSETTSLHYKTIRNNYDSSLGI